MKIDWKKVSKSPGYKSLKAAYIKDVTAKRRSRSKEEFYNTFQGVICRAKHYSHHTGEPIEDILTKWEESRSGWWYGFYKNKPPKFHTNSLKPMGIKGISKFYKADYKYSPELGVRRRQEYINSVVKYTRTKKPKWTARRKKSVR